MRIYTVDQLTPQDVAAITRRFTDMELQSGLDGIFWLPVPPSMLTEVQKSHFDACGPYCLALEVEEESIHLELLVRAMGKLRCDCLSPALPKLREHMIDYLDSLLAELHIPF